MIIKKRIKLGNTDYCISLNCEYKEKDGRTILCLKDYRDDYFDGGDLSKLINQVEQKYSKSIYQKYGDEILFLSDCVYIYDNIPFISGVGDVYISSESYITREELDEYIKIKNIIKKNNKDFKLCDERTWNINN